MINSIYLAWITCARVQKIPQASMFRRLVGEGKISKALIHASQQALQLGADKSMASLWSRCAADMAFLVGRIDEAHAHCHRSLLSGESRLDMAFNALHIAAMRAIAKGDAVHAIRIYADMTHEQFDLAQKCEGLAGMALLYLSFADIEKTSILSNQLVMSASAHSDWAWLGSVIQSEIRLKRAWQINPIFRDHVFWHQDVSGVRVGDCIDSEVALRQSDDAELALYLLRRRQLNLQVLGSAQLSIENLYSQYEWSARELSRFHLMNSLIEQSMVVIGHNKLQLLPQLLALFNSEVIMSHMSYSDSQRLELSYCFYKLFSSQGDDVKAAKHYRNYLLLSANRTRLRVEVENCCDAYKSQSTKILSDDVSARLPARYRRAYQYMQAHLDQNDLSVQDIANTINVSARALQHAFKKYLGESPTEVLRRRRIERVHCALLSGSNHTLIMDVAKKFGINNRTTLTSEYRKLYAELPSRTLKWGAVQSPRSFL